MHRFRAALAAAIQDSTIAERIRIRGEVVRENNIRAAN
jgi:hypothetical protein